MHISQSRRAKAMLGLRCLTRLMGGAGTINTKHCFQLLNLIKRILVAGKILKPVLSLNLRV